MQTAITGGVCLKSRIYIICQNNLYLFAGFHGLHKGFSHFHPAIFFDILKHLSQRRINKHREPGASLKKLLLFFMKGMTDNIH
jgi:dihydrodipicolinate synthase/N-acetylneuraminate lyase